MVIAQEREMEEEAGLDVLLCSEKFFMTMKVEAIQERSRILVAGVFMVTKLKTSQKLKAESTG